MQLMSARNMGLKARIIRKLRQYGQVVAMFRRHGSEHAGLLWAFVFLAVFGTLTESFGVFLLVPLLQTMGKTNVFASVPLIGPMSTVFDELPVDRRLLWAGGLMLIVVLLR